MAITSKREGYIDESAPRISSTHLRLGSSQPKIAISGKVTVTERS